MPRQVTIAGAARTIAVSSFYGMLTEADRAQLQAAAVLQRCAKGSKLMLEGTAASEVNILLGGWAKSASTMPNRTQAVTRIYAPGDLLGLEAVAPHDHLCPETVTAIVPCIFLTLATDRFSDLLDRNRDLAVSFRRTMELRIRTAEEQVKLRFCSPTVQLAYTLLDLAGRHGVQAPDGITIPVELSQDDLADMMAVSRSTVARGLRYLRRAQVVDTGYRRITIAALEPLQKIADGLQLAEQGEGYLRAPGDANPRSIHPDHQALVAAGQSTMSSATITNLSAS